MIPFIDVTLPELVSSVGYLGVFVIVFIESGVPIGLFLPLPGDTLLFSAGLLAATEVFDLLPLIATVIAGAILGDSAGYWFGKKFGTRLFQKEDAIFMNPKNLAKAEAFYAKYGRRAIIFARFLPLFRTIIPIAAGIARMEYGTFLRWNVLSAFVWGISVTMLGYYLGTLIPDVDHYLLPALLVIILLSSGSVILEVLRARKA